MKLTYRGVSYDHLPATLEVTEGDILGKYRGQLTRQHCVAQTIDRPEMESVILHYRGSSYAVMQPKVAVSAQSQQAPAPTCPVQFSQLSQLMSPDVHQVHLENMRRSLERRIQMAQAKGDNHLVNLLQQESNALPSG